MESVASPTNFAKISAPSGTPRSEHIKHLPLLLRSELRSTPLRP